MFITLLILALVAGYSVVGMTVTRLKYKREYRRYLTWRNEGGTYMHMWGGDYRPPTSRNRREASYGNYRKSVATTCPPGLAGWSWPVYLPTLAITKFVHPEVKAPDYHKISELESL